jgi:rhodanese-related sulfurtransferase
VIPSVDREELKALIASGERFVLLDVRDTPDYEKEHIVGALHLLIADMDAQRVRELFGPEARIVVYSQDIDCPAKFIAAKKLRELGFPHVSAYPGSWKDWKEAGLPTEPGTGS